MENTPYNNQVQTSDSTPETPLPQNPPQSGEITPPQPKRFNKKLVLSVLALIVLLGGGALAFFHFHKTAKVSNSTSPTSTTSKNQPAEQPTPTYATVLVYQPSSTGSSSTTSIVGLDGNVLHTFSSKATTNTYSASSFSMENIELLEGSFLITTDKSWSSFAILTPDGKARDAASSLTTLLAGNAHPNSTNNLSSGIAVGESTFYALESSSGSTAVKLVKIDVAGGTNTTLLTADATKQEGAGYTPLQLVTVSRDGKTAYLISNDAKLGSTATSGAQLVVCDTSTGKFTTKTLPDGVNPESASVSKDGKWLAYIAYGSNNGYGNATTHIFNVASGKDVAVAQEGLLTSSGANDVRFSPDGSYVSVIGNYPADAKKAGMALQIISTATNAVVQQVDQVGVQNQVTGFDWSSDNKMIYATNSSSTGNFDVTKEVVHSIDASTGKIFKFPRALGELDAVLNFQK